MQASGLAPATTQQLHCLFCPGPVPLVKVLSSVSCFIIVSHAGAHGGMPASGPEAVPQARLSSAGVRTMPFSPPFTVIPS